MYVASINFVPSPDDGRKPCSGYATSQKSCMPKVR